MLFQKLRMQIKNPEDRLYQDSYIFHVQCLKLSGTHIEFAAYVRGKHHQTYLMFYISVKMLEVDTLLMLLFEDKEVAMLLCKETQTFGYSDEFVELAETQWITIV